MNPFVLAARNLQRNGRRTFVTLLALVIGTAAILLLGGYARDITYGLQTIYVQRSGHLQLFRSGYPDFGMGNPSAYGIADSNAIIDLVQQDAELGPMLTVATDMLHFGGIAASPGQATSITVVGHGVVAQDQQRMLAWNGHDVPTPSAQHDLGDFGTETAVIGIGVARMLQMCDALGLLECPRPPASADGDASPTMPGDLAVLATHEATQPGLADATPQLDVLTASIGGAPNIARLAVVQAVRQGLKDFDNTYVAMHLAQAQKLVFGPEEPKVTTIVMQLARTEQITAARERLQWLVSGPLHDADLEIRDVFELNPTYGQTISMVRALFAFVASLLVVIVLFTVSNTMSIAIMERTEEIGTLRAMGVQRKGIRWLFIAEGMLLGVTGWLAGVVLAFVVAWVLERLGIPWSPPGMAIEIPVTARFWNAPLLIVLTGLGMALVSILSAWLPARRAAHMNIVDALRHV